MQSIYYRSQAGQELRCIDNSLLMQLLYLHLMVVWVLEHMQSKQQCWLSVRSLHLSLSLSLNPGLTHAILISLLRDNHDPEGEREELKHTLADMALVPLLFLF